jgi:ABC-type Fe3+/spermidine/putrescine transport system ATPase subunit
LARAVAHPPRVLLMDEPLGALDVKLRETMQAEIQHIQRRLGITTVFVTHDQSEAMSMSDWIVVMNRGRIVQAGTARDLYDHPRSRFVADFFGRINLLPIIVRDNAWVEVLGRTLRHSSARSAGPAILAVRPEHLRLLPTDADGLPGRIVTIQFLGNLIRCDVVLAADIIVTVETTPDDPLAVPDTAVRIAWDTDKFTLFDHEPTSPPQEDPHHADAI